MRGLSRVGSTLLMILCACSVTQSARAGGPASQPVSPDRSLTAQQLLDRLSGALAWADDSVIRMEGVATFLRRKVPGAPPKNELSYTVERYQSARGQLRINKRNLDGGGEIGIYVTPTARVISSAGVVTYTESTELIARA